MSTAVLFDFHIEDLINKDHGMTCDKNLYIRYPYIEAWIAKRCDCSSSAFSIVFNYLPPLAPRPGFAAKAQTPKGSGKENASF